MNNPDTLLTVDQLRVELERILGRPVLELRPTSEGWEAVTNEGNTLKGKINLRTSWDNGTMRVLPVVTIDDDV